MKSFVFRQSDSRELPASLGRKEIAVSRPNVRGRGRARAASQNKLITHELGVVLAQGPRGWARARIGCVRAASPLPDIAETLSNSRAVDGGLGMKKSAFQEISVGLLVA